MTTTRHTIRALAAAGALALAACGGIGSAGTENTQVTLSSGTVRTVAEQRRHIDALIKDQGYTLVCAVAMADVAPTPAANQSLQDTLLLRQVHVEQCEKARE